MVRKKENKGKSRELTMRVLRPNAAGIDIGAREIFVAVPPGSDVDGKDVRSFPTFTQDLKLLAKWLESCGVDTVAMESTGVYWIPLFQILEDAGIEVYLVNAHHVRNVAGRKSDVLDCQWLRELHAFGFLNSSFRPPHLVCAVRSLIRHRDGLTRTAASHVHRMQKALTQMNLQIHHVLSDITGKSGLAILDAILDGQRDPHRLYGLCSKRVKASEDVIIKSLVGDYRPEHIFTLKQSLKAYRMYQSMMEECEQEIRNLLQQFGSRVEVQKNDGSLRAELTRILGVDLTTIPSLGADTVQKIVSEVGTDFSKFRSASAFASWLALCPNNKITGGKVLTSHTKKTTSRAAAILRMAAQSLHHSSSALGALYRRMRAQHGAKKAITAAAHKLACLIYQLVTTGQEYDEARFARDHCSKARQERSLRAKAKALGFELVAVPVAP